MAQSLDPSERVTFKELLMANAMQVDSEINLLIKQLYGMTQFISHRQSSAGGR